MKHKNSMMRIVAKRTWGLVVAVVVPATCWAHPGHGADGGDWSVRHYFTEPVHLAGGALALTLVLIGASLWRVICAHRKRIDARIQSVDPVSNQQNPITQ